MMSDADSTHTTQPTATRRPAQSYLLGAAYGLIPAAVEGLATFLANKTTATDLAFLLGNIGLILYGVAVPAALICLVLPARRWLGFGLLTVAGASGIVVFGLLSQSNL